MPLVRQFYVTGRFCVFNHYITKQNVGKFSDLVGSASWAAFCVGVPRVGWEYGEFRSESHSL